MYIIVFNIIYNDGTAIRYLILDKIGGMYVDFDTECLASHNDLLKDKTCCFSMEPKEHGKRFGRELFFNNAMMACVPGHPFMKKIVDTVFQYKKPDPNDLSRRNRVIRNLLHHWSSFINNTYEELY